LEVFERESVVEIGAGGKPFDDSAGREVAGREEMWASELLKDFRELLVARDFYQAAAGPITTNPKKCAIA
jgi:hypothetical protein